ncbi:MAG: polyphosphate kinase 1 [Proteobacteria bacterium]|nr:polyphosphate kinase 1 [Pseudomonadota bacterium]
MSTQRYLNRELSWMAFNERVLEEALDPATPLLERLRFLTIFHTNLDEFFMIRVSGLKQQVAAGVDMLSPDGLSPRGQLHRVAERLKPTLERAQHTLLDSVLPELAEHDVHIVHYASLSAAERKTWDDWYLRHVHPVLTPLAVGPTHPFPFISNLSLNLGLFVTSSAGEARFARVKVPGMLDRLIPLDGEDTPGPVRLLALEELIAANLDSLFPGMTLSEAWAFRVTRDADVAIKDDEADDLLQVIQEGIRRRRFGQAVRLEVQAGMPAEMIETIQHGLDLDGQDLYSVRGMLGVSRLSEIIDLDLPELKYPPFVPRRGRVLGDEPFAAIRAQPILLHHPYESFNPVVDFVRKAARDPAVLAIKQTLYRTSGNSPVIQALEEAVENGKQVAAIVELKARFDEENNIVWARRLEEAGVHVIYGVTGLKTHCKMTLVIRQEHDMLRRYAHIGTGNYNATTARVYTDLGLFTSDRNLTADVANLFNRLTGFAEPAGFRKLLVAPRHMKRELIELIRREAEHAEAGRPARIIIKANSVTDTQVIDELYAASARGVEVDLLVRGICCLIPGLPGLSERIRVRSVVGRFLEHSRVYWFDNGGTADAYIGSADMMDRNMERRVEILAPLQDAELTHWLRETFLRAYLDDRGRTREMQSDGSYVRLRKAPEDPDVHRTFQRG